MHVQQTRREIYVLVREVETPATLAVYGTGSEVIVKHMMIPMKATRQNMLVQHQGWSVHFRCCWSLRSVLVPKTTAKGNIWLIRFYTLQCVYQLVAN